MFCYYNKVTDVLSQMFCHNKVNKVTDVLSHATEMGGNLLGGGEDTEAGHGWKTSRSKGSLSSRKTLGKRTAISPPPPARKPPEIRVGYSATLSFTCRGKFGFLSQTVNPHRNDPF